MARHRPPRPAGLSLCSRVWCPAEPPTLTCSQAELLLKAGLCARRGGCRSGPWGPRGVCCWSPTTGCRRHVASSVLGGLMWPMGGAIAAGWFSLCTCSLAQELRATRWDSASSPGQTCSRELLRLTCRPADRLGPDLPVWFHSFLLVSAPGRPASWWRERDSTGSRRWEVLPRPQQASGAGGPQGQRWTLGTGEAPHCLPCGSSGRPGVTCPKALVLWVAVTGLGLLPGGGPGCSRRWCG